MALIFGYLSFCSIRNAIGFVKTEIPEETKTDEQGFNLSDSQEVLENTDETQPEINKIAPAAGCVKAEIPEETKTDEQEFNLNQKLVHPYSLGGNSTLNNLRLLCASV